jgi:ADP-ribose pyrophosphatase
MDDRKLADLPADVTLSAPELLAKGYRPYQRYQVALRGLDGEPIAQQRDVIKGGKVAAVIAVDLARDEIVLIRQFRLSAHLANGNGELLEIVAGRVEAGESPADAARRECTEEIRVAPSALAELFSYLTSPGITDEEVTVFVAAVDASQVPRRVVNPAEGEHIETLRVSIDAAIAALAQGTMRSGPLIVGLQWLALNRGRVATLLGASGRAR